ncbi:mechanosensitive ion channel family protein [Falsiporphyromonas endometrii]|uniref:Mechanosensitive ion channel family protein n=1 Tax=Falsiporphyromonas endometrii TaxID=1387297 RepID=A0ABV9K5N1_9PORP
MNTTEIAFGLLNAVRNMLMWMGMSSQMAKALDESIFLCITVVVSFLISWVIYLVLEKLSKKVLKFKRLTLLEAILEKRCLKHISLVFPALIISAFLQVTFKHSSAIFKISSKVTWIYFSLALMLAINSVLKAMGKTMMGKEKLRNRPLKGLVQIIQVIVCFLTAITVVAIIINKSPVAIITGLGAFAAVLMLIFKDTILGLVAGVQLAQNDMIQIGDWISVPSANVDGVVLDITLNTVKVQNWDNTISTLPPYSLVSGVFTNWRGMSESGGRRIVKQYLLKLDSIKPCTEEFLNRMKEFDTDLKKFIEIKQQQQDAGQVRNTENPQKLVNGTIETNAGLFRAYMKIYLDRHPSLNKDLTLMVRTLDATPNGLPLQLYCFSANKAWESYESIASEIMEHCVAVMPFFDLEPFQNPSAQDYIISGMLEGGTPYKEIEAMTWHIPNKPEAPKQNVQQKPSNKVNA